MKPQYVYTQNVEAKIAISKKEEEYPAALNGTKHKILKTPEKYLLKKVDAYAAHCKIINKNTEITMNF